MTHTLSIGRTIGAPCAHGALGADLPDLAWQDALAEIREYLQDIGASLYSDTEGPCFDEAGAPEHGAVFVFGYPQPLDLERLQDIAARYGQRCLAHAVAHDGADFPAGRISLVDELGEPLFWQPARGILETAEGDRLICAEGDTFRHLYSGDPFEIRFPADSVWGPA